MCTLTRIQDASAILCSFHRTHLEFCKTIKNFNSHCKKGLEVREWRLLLIKLLKSLLVRDSLFAPFPLKCRSLEFAPLSHSSPPTPPTQLLSSILLVGLFFRRPGLESYEFLACLFIYFSSFVVFSEIGIRLALIFKEFHS